MKNKHLDLVQRQKLATDETITAWIEALRDEDALAGVAFVTERRVGFYRKRFTGEIFEAIPLSKVSSVETSTGIFGRKIRIHTSGDSLKLVHISNGQGNAEIFMATLQDAQKAKAIAPRQVARVEPVDPIGQLERLSRLKDAGHITAEEFESMKAHLLSRI